MNTEQLAAIKARCEAATPGPWQFDDGYRVCNEFGIVTMALALDNAVARADATFISSARQDVPALLAHAEAETARADAVRRERNQTAASVLGGEVEGRPTGPHNWIQRARALVETERAHAAAVEAAFREGWNYGGWDAVGACNGHPRSDWEQSAARAALAPAPADGEEVS